jgi:preprotein translocase subunit SecG
MEILATLALVAQILSALGVIVLVLIQHGKGADMGAAFGSGTSGSLFGATGSANFLSRLTAGLATLFFVCTLVLAFIATDRPTATGSVMERVGTPPGVDPSVPPGTVLSPGVPAAPAGTGTAVPAAGDAEKSGPAGAIPK